MSKWQGPAKITEINDINAHILLSKSKTKVLNIMRLKKIFSPDKTAESETVSEKADLDFNGEPKVTGPITRAMKN